MPDPLDPAEMARQMKAARAPRQAAPVLDPSDMAAQMKAARGTPAAPKEEPDPFYAKLQSGLAERKARREANRDPVADWLGANVADPVVASVDRLNQVGDDMMGAGKRLVGAFNPDAVVGLVEGTRSDVKRGIREDMADPNAGYRNPAGRVLEAGVKNLGRTLAPPAADALQIAGGMVAPPMEVYNAVAPSPYEGAGAQAPAGVRALLAAARAPVDLPVQAGQIAAESPLGDVAQSLGGPRGREVLAGATTLAAGAPIMHALPRMRGAPLPEAPSGPILDPTEFERRGQPGYEVTPDMGLPSPYPALPKTSMVGPAEGLSPTLRVEPTVPGTDAVIAPPPVVRRSPLPFGENLGLIEPGSAPPTAPAVRSRFGQDPAAEVPPGYENGRPLARDLRTREPVPVRDVFPDVKTAEERAAESPEMRQVREALGLTAPEPAAVRRPVAPPPAPAPEPTPAPPPAPAAQAAPAEAPAAAPVAKPKLSPNVKAPKQAPPAVAPAADANILAARKAMPKAAPEALAKLLGVPVERVRTALGEPAAPPEPVPAAPQRFSAEKRVSAAPDPAAVAASTPVPEPAPKAVEPAKALEEAKSSTTPEPVPTTPPVVSTVSPDAAGPEVRPVPDKVGEKTAAASPPAAEPAAPRVRQTLRPDVTVDPDGWPMKRHERSDKSLGDWTRMSAKEADALRRQYPQGWNEKKLERAPTDEPAAPVAATLPREPWQMRRGDFLKEADLRARERAVYFDANGKRLASSREAPSTAEQPPLGSWRIGTDSTWNKYGDSIEQLREIPVEKVKGSEDSFGREGDVERYAGWLREGRLPPPIRAAEMPDGTFKIMDGHRRLLAHEKAGVATIRAWVAPEGKTGLLDPSGKDIGTDLTHQMVVKQALAEGKPVPPEVLAEYPDIGKPVEPVPTTGPQASPPTPDVGTTGVRAANPPEIATPEAIHAKVESRAPEFGIPAAENGLRPTEAPIDPAFAAAERGVLEKAGEAPKAAAPAKRSAGEKISESSRSAPAGTFYGPDGELRMKLTDIVRDPAEFQHRPADAKGVTDQYRGVKVWDNNTHALTVWRDPTDGQIKLANGHQRYGIAERAGQPDVPVKFVRAKNAAEAKVEAMWENLRGGTASPEEAARILKTLSLDAPEKVAAAFEKRGVTPNTPGVREGRALAALPDALWSEYMLGEQSTSHPERYYVDLGNAIREAGLTSDQALDLGKQLDAGGERIKPRDYVGIARRIKFAGEASSGGGASGSLFGADAEPSMNLYALGAELDRGLLEDLGAERGYKKIGEKAGDLERKGVGKIDAQTAKDLAASSRKIHGLAAGLIDSNARNPVHDIVSEFARAVDSGKYKDSAAAIPDLRERVLEWLRKNPATRDDMAIAEGKGGLFCGGRKMSADDLKGAAGTTESPKPKKPPKGDDGPTGRKFGSRGEAGMALTPFSPDSWKGLAKPLADATARAAERVKRTVQGVSLPEFLRNSIDRLEDFARAEAPIARLERARDRGISPTGPTEQAIYAQGAAGKQAETMWEHGHTDVGNVKAIGEAVDAVIKHSEGDKLTMYLVARRTLARYEPHGLDSGFDPNWARDFKAKMEANYPRVVEAANRLNAADRFLRAELERAGGITPQANKALDAMMPEDNFYAPMERVLSDSAEGTMTSSGGPLGKSSYKRISAGERISAAPMSRMPPVRDPLMRYFEQLRQMWSRVNNARTAGKIAEWYDADPKGAAVAGMKEVAAFGKNKTTFDQFSADYTTKNPTATPVEVLNAWEAELPAGTLQAVVGGKLRAFEFADPHVMEAMQTMRAGESFSLAQFLKGHGSGGKLADVVDLADAGLRGLTRIKRLTTTGINAAFAGTQLLMDIPTWYVMTESKGLLGQPRAKDVFVNLPRGYADGIYQGLREAISGESFLPETKLSQVYERAPVEGFYDVDMSRGPRGLKTGIGKLGEALRPIDRAQRLMGGIEGGPRRAEGLSYLDSIGKTVDDPLTLDEYVQMSNRMSKATVPFKLGSKMSKGISQYAAYSNAGVQALKIASDVVRAHKARTAARIMAISVIPTITFWALNHDKEEYKRSPLYERYGYNTLVGPERLRNNRLFSLPAVAVQMALDKLALEDPPAAKELAKQYLQMMGQELPAVVPDVPKAAVEIATDHSFFTGREINPPGLQGVETQQPWRVSRRGDPRVAEWASKALRDASAALGVKSEWTTAEISYLARNFIGPVGVETAKALDQPVGTPEPSDTPIAGRFLKPISSSRYTQEFWARQDEWEGASKTSRLARSQGDMRSALTYHISPADVTAVTKVKEALKDLREKYQQAPSVEAKRALALMMDVQAKRGNAVMDRALGRVEKMEDAPAGR